MTHAELLAVEARIAPGAAALYAAIAAQPPRVHVRWAVGRDTEAILAIDAASFDPPMVGEAEWRAMMRCRNVIGMVAECTRTDAVVGYFAYRLTPRRIDLLTFAVSPEARRRGVGTLMAAKLAGKLRPGFRETVRADVPERDLAALKFFTACGWRATGLVPTDGPDDAVRMEFDGRGL